MLFLGRPSLWEPRLLRDSLRLESAILLCKAKGPCLSHSKQKLWVESGCLQILTPLPSYSTTGHLPSHTLLPLPGTPFPLVWICSFLSFRPDQIPSRTPPPPPRPTLKLQPYSIPLPFSFSSLPDIIAHTDLRVYVCLCVCYTWTYVCVCVHTQVCS